MNELKSSILYIYFLYIHKRIKINIFNFKIMVTMATKTNGSYVTLFEKCFFFQLKIRKLTIRTMNINLMENICIDKLFSMSLGTNIYENCDDLRRTRLISERFFKACLGANKGKF